MKISRPEQRDYLQINWLMNNYMELGDLGIRKKKEIYDVIGIVLIGIMYYGFVRKTTKQNNREEKRQIRLIQTFKFRRICNICKISCGAFGEIFEGKLIS